ncbi:MAG TPA: hypothetical protein VFN55_15985 [Solirubrobacteraceae bacterium]|nr:hypothetical protein [Solirubrobacteraceae bacterium]
MKPRPSAAVMAVIALLLAGCGASGLSAAQVRTRATRICELAADRTARIPLPTDPSGGQRFLDQGIAALTPEVRALRGLSDHGALRTAVVAIADELAALRSSRRGLRAGNDPVVAIKTLQQQLLRAEERANAAWRALKVPACVSR